MAFNDPFQPKLFYDLRILFSANIIELSMDWHNEVHPGLVLRREAGEKAVQKMGLCALQQSWHPVLRRTVLLVHILYIYLHIFFPIKITKFCNPKVPFTALVHFPSLTPAVIMFCCKKCSVCYESFEILSVLEWARKKWRDA